MSKRSITVIAGAALLLSGCGSTLPLATQRAMEGSGPSGAGSAGGIASATGGGNASSVGGGTSGLGGLPGGSAAGGAPAAGAVGSSNGSAAGGSGVIGGGSGATGPAVGVSSPGSPASSSSAGGSSGGTDGPGVTATTINIGDYYDPNASAEDSALGFGGLNPGDIQAETNAVVAYVNSHGGVAHRKLNVIWAQMSSTSNIQQGEQATCNTWTVDNKVLITLGGNQIWDQCAANAHAVAITSGDIAQETTPTEAQYPADFNLTGMTVDRAMRYTVEGIARQGYFAHNARVGVVTWDGLDFRYGVSQVLPLLSKMGFSNPPVQYVSEPQSYGQISGSSADISNAILKFRSEGIDHVLLFDGTAGVFSGAGLALLFMNAANSQSYYPDYGLNTTSGLSTTTPDVPAKEMQNSSAIGWIPSLDLAGSDFAAYPQSPQAKLCLQIVTAAGQAPSGANAEANAFQICDFVFFVQTALNAVRGPLNQADVLTAINGLGTGFPVITTFQDYFSPSRHDGPQLVRDAAFNTSCTCFRYTSTAYNPG